MNATVFLVAVCVCTAWLAEQMRIKAVSSITRSSAPTTCSCSISKSARSVSQSLKSVSQSVSQSGSQSVRQLLSVSQSVSQTVSQSVSQSVIITLLVSHSAKQHLRCSLSLSLSLSLFLSFVFFPPSGWVISLSGPGRRSVARSLREIRRGSQRGDLVARAEAHGEEPGQRGV